jgi:hypothetical protein
VNLMKGSGGRLPGGPVFGTAAWLLAALLCASLLAACAQERVAGGDDFPNSVETLGKNGTADRNDSTEWNAYRSAPDTAPGMYDSTYVPDTIPRDEAVLLKTGIIPVGLTVIGIIPGRHIPRARHTHRGRGGEPRGAEAVVHRAGGA